MVQICQKFVNFVKFSSHDFFSTKWCNCCTKRAKPFNSHGWPTQNFSLQYQYNIKQTSDENKEKYQLEDYWLIQYQIPKTNITRTVWQTVRRIINEILGVKGLRVVISTANLIAMDWDQKTQGYMKVICS